MSCTTLQCYKERGTKAVKWQKKCTLRFYVRSDATDVSTVWFCDHDYMGFKKRCKILSELGKEIGADAIELYCKESCRGLEHLMDENTRNLRKRRRELALEAVLEEQQQQRESKNGYSDIEKISIVYRLLSDDAHADAHRLALEDANEVGASSGASKFETCATFGSTKTSFQDSTPKHHNGLAHGALMKSSQPSKPETGRIRTREGLKNGISLLS